MNLDNFIQGMFCVYHTQVLTIYYKLHRNMLHLKEQVGNFGEIHFEGMKANS